jgi:hypothetical protein
MDENSLEYSDDSGFGREVAGDSDFDRDDLEFTTDEGSSMFSRALTSIESLSAIIREGKKLDKRPASKAIKIKESNKKPVKKKVKKSEKKPTKNS